MDIETVFHTFSGYPISGIIKNCNQNYYIHSLEIYDGMILYTASPLSDDDAELLMRNQLELRQIIELATYTLEFNTTNNDCIWKPVTEQTIITLPASGAYLYKK